MRILIISRSPWRLDNSFGNTYSSIFRGMKDVEIANIYLADGFPEYEENVKAYYQVSEKELVSSLKHPFAKNKIGSVIYAENNSSLNKEKDCGYLTLGKNKRWPIMFIARELIWKFGRINYDGIDSFVASFKPDIIFLPFYYAVYVFRVALYIQKKFNLPMTGEACLDIYSLKQLSFDPFYWFNRFAIRRWVRRAAKHSAHLYFISEKMRKDYSGYLDIEGKILYKIPDFSRMQSKYYSANKPIKFLFTGNIGANRWKTLSLLAATLKELDFGHLDIYTASPINDKINKELNIEGYSKVHAPVSQDEVKVLQNKADVLVHAESFDLANKLLVRYSISTKIMDYLCTGRTILALGPNDVASIEYLRDNDAALVASSKKEIVKTVQLLKRDKNILLIYSQKGLDFAKSHMNADEMKLSLYKDMKEIIKEHEQKINKR